MNIGIVLPVYNEEKKIEQVLEKLKSQDLVIYVVDDGSTDTSNQIITKFSRRLKRIKSYRHTINLGKGAAIKTGFDAAFADGMDAVIMMDSDGQHSTRDLNKFIEKLETKRYDMVLGSRSLGRGVPLIRFFGNKFASVLITLLFSYYISDILCGFRAITKNAYGKLKIESTGYGVETEMIVKASKYKLKICEVGIETIYHDKHKGVTILDSIGILLDVLRWRIVL